MKAVATFSHLAIVLAAARAWKHDRWKLLHTCGPTCLVALLLMSPAAVSGPVSELYGRYAIQGSGVGFTTPLDGPNAPARSYDAAGDVYNQSTNSGFATYRGLNLEEYLFEHFDAQLTATVDSSGRVQSGLFAASGSSALLGIDGQVLLLGQVVDWGWEGFDNREPQPLPNGICDPFDTPCASVFLWTVTIIQLDYAHPSLNLEDFIVWSQSATTRARNLTTMADLFSTDLWAGGAPLNTYLSSATAVVSEPSSIWLAGLLLIAPFFRRTCGKEGVRT